MHRIIGICLFVCAAFASAAGAQTFRLTINRSESDAGIVSVDAGDGTTAECRLGSPGSGLCSYDIASAATVTISAATAETSSGVPGSFFGGSGPAAACGFSVCSFAMTGDAGVQVSFNPANGATAKVFLTLAGTGVGSARAGAHRCQNDDLSQTSACTTTYLQGTTLAIRPEAGSASRFSGYTTHTGSASSCGVSGSCTFTLTTDSSITARFAGLVSLWVSPRSATKAVGETQAFVAEGDFDDRTIETICTLPACGRTRKGRWSVATTMPAARSRLAAVTVDGKIYAFGGYGMERGGSLEQPLNTMDVYDPAADAWTTRAAMRSPRIDFAGAAAGGFIYAIGGSSSAPLAAALAPLASVERYDPATDTWIDRAPLPAPRVFFGAATVDGIIYAIGGSNGAASSTMIAAVDAYDPSADAWSSRAPLPTPRRGLAVAVVDDIVYAVGGAGTDGFPTATVEAYDPRTNTWRARAPLPVKATSASAAAIDGVLYVIVGSGTATFAYDPRRDTWSTKQNPPPGNITESYGAAAAAGVVLYAIGGEVIIHIPHPTTNVYAFTDSLRWSSSAASVAAIGQDGTASAVAPGEAMIRVSGGRITCDLGCVPFFSYASYPTDMALDLPAANAIVTTATPLVVSGWALNKGAATGTGVDGIHVYAHPLSGSPIFLGVATYGLARPDVGAIYGARFTNVGFSLSVPVSLAPGNYTIYAYGHDTLTDTFDVARGAAIVIQAAPSSPFMSVDTPATGATLTSAFEIGGWALDAGASVGTGVDRVRFFVQPQGAPAPGVFIGTGSYGWPRPDVGAIFGLRFNNTGYHFTITGLSPGSFTLNVYAHSTVANADTVTSVPFTIGAIALLSVDVPFAEAVASAATGFSVSGWSIDRAVESTPLAGSGVDTLHVYAYPDPGSGRPPIFLGVAGIGFWRPDVGALYGSRYDTSGYTLVVNRGPEPRLTAGVYDIAVVSHSAVSGTFNTVAVVRITLQ